MFFCLFLFDFNNGNRQIIVTFNLRYFGWKSLDGTEPGVRDWLSARLHWEWYPVTYWLIKFLPTASQPTANHSQISGRRLSSILGQD